MSNSEFTSDRFKFKRALEQPQGALQNFVIIDGDFIEPRELTVSNLAADAIDLAYEVNGKAFALKDSTINGGRLADTHWEMLSVSHDGEATNQYGYKAVAFINRYAHEIHIASAGTVLNYHDIRDDILLTLGKVPYKLQPLKGLVDRVVQEVGGDTAAKAYQFSTSGHSLGAVVADLTGLEIASRGLRLVSSTTFENPGSEKAIQAVLDKHGFSGKIDSGQLAKLRQYYKVYNAKPNLINTTQAQFGQCYWVQSRTTEPTQISYTPWSFIKNLQGILCGGLANNLIKEYTGFNKFVQSVKEVKKDHPLQNFQNLDKQTKIAVEQWPTRWNRNASLYKKSVSPDRLKEWPTQSSSRQEIIFKEESEPSHIKVLRTYLTDAWGVAAHLTHWFGGGKITKPVNFLPGEQATTPATALTECHLQADHPVHNEPDLGYESDFSRCSDQAIDEALISDAVLREQLGAFSHPSLSAKQSTDSTHWSYPKHSVFTLIACR